MSKALGACLFSAGLFAACSLETGVTGAVDGRVVGVDGATLDAQVRFDGRPPPRTDGPIPSRDGALPGDDAGPDVDAGTRRDGGPIPVDAGPSLDGGACPLDPTPPGRPMCPAVCNGGCASGVCTIDCTGGGVCDGRSIACPPDYACRIICDGVDACDNGTVTCPDIYACSLECRGGNDACGNMDMRCGTGSCSIECSSDACSGAIIGCGSGPCTASCTGTPHPTSSGCSASCGCTRC